MKILVTGGLGYIGSHTVLSLIDQNHQVVIVDNLSNSLLKIHSRLEFISKTTIPFYQVGVHDELEMTKVFLEHPDLEAVIHFAAFKAVGESVKNPVKYYDNNISGLISLLKVMDAFPGRIENFVFSSSCTVYGNEVSPPVSEEAPITVAYSPYGNTKIICENLLKEYAALKEIGVVSLRYFNPIGAHESGLLGELPIGTPNNLVPFITQTAIGKRKELTIFGDTYNTPDGTNIRDYIHVVDLAEAHVRAINYIHEHPECEFEAFNIGTGKGNSVLEIVQTFESVNNLKLNYKIGPARPGDVDKIWSNTSKALKVLNWKPKLNLEKMLISSWVWEQNIDDFVG